MKYLLFSLFLTGLLQASALDAKTQTVFLLRHAEKASAPNADPILSEAGVARAARLPGMFENAPPQAVFSSQFQRTKLTALPLAQAVGIEVHVMPVTKENAAHYADQIREQICALPDRSIVVVVGHSNTIPDTITRLTGEPVTAIGESRHNQIFMVRLNNCMANTYSESTY